MENTRTDVLIVGAGPTGLTLACSLARAGVGFHLIDKITERSPYSRALVVQLRSLEIFNQLGIADGLLPQGNQAGNAKLFVKRKLKVELPIFDVAYKGCRFDKALFIEQGRTEHALDECLAALGSKAHFGHELLSFEETADGVTARCRGENEYSVEATYIVGCDGAHSAVRHGKGIAFEGAAYAQDFMLVDLDIEWDQPRDAFMAFQDRDGFMALFPMKDRSRLIAARGRYREDAPEPTLDDFREVFQRLVPYEAELSNPVWLARFHLHHRIAERFRSGRVMLAGDAAHIHSPVGGQGMNTGIQDAWNLGWKLAWALKSPATAETLLESYHEERHPVGESLLRTTDAAFNFVAGQGWFAKTARSWFAPWALPLGASLPPIRNRARYLVTELGISYHGSSLCGPGGGHPRPGDRMPDFEIDGESLHAMLDPVRPTVLCVGDLPAESSDWKSIHLAEPTAHHRDLLGIKDGCYFLIRPDAHLAARGGGNPEIEAAPLTKLAPT
ncbi:MAG: FAD-dependent monooxygenase [Planctomycetes bacterium]|nr:FAD-dependent monooxygenase [Planctomycetota bacterium]